METNTNDINITTEKINTAIANTGNEKLLLDNSNFISSFKMLENATQKSVTIKISPNDLKALKQNKYKLCFAKRVGEETYNVVWQSYSKYLQNNKFSWTPQYQIFGCNTFEESVTVETETDMIDIGLGQKCILDEYGILHDAITGSNKYSLSLENQYGSIHPGVSQVCHGINGERVSLPFYVATKQCLKGPIKLTPIEKVLVWFEQNIETSVMFSEARSNAIEIDLTYKASTIIQYNEQEWSIIG